MSDVFISRDEARKDMLAASAYLGERIRSADGHAEAMNAVVPLYLAAKEVDLAAELSNAVEDPFARDRLLTMVAEKCADLDDDEYALQLADSIEDHALQAQALERIGLIKARKGQIAAAKEIAESMVHPEFVYAAVAVEEMKQGDKEAAVETLAEIGYPAAAVSAIEQIAASSINSGDKEGSADWLDRCVEAAEQIEHDEERIRTLVGIGGLAVDAARNDKAVETFELARQSAAALENMHRDHFLAACALGFMRAGSEDMMDRTLDLIRDKTQMASALIARSLELWRQGSREDAIDTLDEANSILQSQRENEIRDPRARTALITTAAAQFATFELSDRAVETALDIVDPDQQAGALSQVAQVLGSRGEDDQARQAVEMIGEDSSRLIALISLADVKKRAGQMDQAKAFLAEAADLVETIPQFGMRAEILNAIADRFATWGDPERARQAALESLNVIAQLRDESVQAASLAELSRVYRDASLELQQNELNFLDSLTSK